MKKLIAFICVAATMFALTGCFDGRVQQSPKPSNSPVHTVKPSPSAKPQATAVPSPSMVPTQSDKPDDTADNKIEDFVEGAEVDIKALPEKVSEAVKKAYNAVAIKAVSFATYMNSQTYLVTLAGEGDKTEKIYVKPDGTIVPAESENGKE